MAKFYSARSRTIPPLPWQTFALPFSRLVGIKPVSYPIPDDGPVGKMLKSLGRHPYRPALMHFLITAPGHSKIATQTFVSDDAVFAVKQTLVAQFERVKGKSEWRCLFDFIMVAAGEEESGAV